MRVLVVDDDDALRSALHRALRQAGHDVTLAASGTAAWRFLDRDEPDVLILDVLMDQPDGLQVCRRLRELGRQVPILMLTAADGIGDRVAGLDAGADDYLVKPFVLDELLARLRALTRRTLTAGGPLLRYADLTLDQDTFEAHRGTRRLELTRTEHSLLRLFLAHPRKVLTREVIYERIWGYEAELSSNSLDVFVGYLRRKTEAGGEPRLIQTVRGVGYVLREP